MNSGARCGGLRLVLSAGFSSSRPRRRRRNSARRRARTAGDKPAAKPAPRKPAAPPAASPSRPTDAGTGRAGRELDVAYGAYQRGYYLTALRSRRGGYEEKDVKAMTLLGELYANGFGVERDDKKAAEWYQLAADRGDREAMFALAMFHSRDASAAQSRGGRQAPRRRRQARARRRRLRPRPLYLEGGMFPQDFARAAELFRSAAQAGNPEAQYALATLYKEGRGVPKDLVEAARLLAAAALADNTDAQVEYAIALFNGTGVARTRAAPRRC